MIVTITAAFFGGLILYFGLPIILAQVYPITIRKQIGDLYFWLAMHSFRRLTFVRKKLGGVNLQPISVDSQKKTGTYETHKEQHVDDPANTVDRIYGKPVLVQPEQVPAAVSATLAELGQAWHQHVRSGAAVKQEEVATAQDGSPIQDEKVNPYFDVPSGNHMIDPADFIRLVANDSNPDDPAKAEAYTDKSQEGFKDNVGAVETVSLLTGFIGSLVTVVGVDRYLLDGSGGGASTPAPPIPIGMLDVTATIDIGAVLGVIPL